MVLTTFSVLTIFKKSYLWSSFSTSPINSPRGCQFAYPKSIKIHNNKNLIIVQIGILAREVSKISVLAFPCCMGSICFCDPYEAWERHTRTWRHLPSEKAIFAFVNTSPAGSSTIIKKIEFPNRCVCFTCSIILYCSNEF